MVGAWCRLVATMPNKFKRADILEANSAGTGHFSFRVQVTTARESPRSARTGVKATRLGEITGGDWRGEGSRGRTLPSQETCRLGARGCAVATRKPKPDCSFGGFGLAQHKLQGDEASFRAGVTLDLPSPNNTTRKYPNPTFTPDFPSSMWQCSVLDYTWRSALPREC